MHHDIHVSTHARCHFGTNIHPPVWRAAFPDGKTAAELPHKTYLCRSGCVVNPSVEFYSETVVVQVVIPRSSEKKETC